MKESKNREERKEEVFEDLLLLSLSHNMSLWELWNWVESTPVRSPHVDRIHSMFGELEPLNEAPCNFHVFRNET